jgi:hypothetical protein
VTSGYINATVTQDTNVAFDKIVTFVIPLVALLMSTPVMWCEESLWIVSVLQIVHCQSKGYHPPIYI